MQNFQHISVTVKVLRINEKVEVKPDLNKQDVTIADATGTAHLTLWQKDIGQMELHKSYLLQDVVIKSYNNTKYLTPPKSGCKIIPHDDIGSVQDEPETENNKMDEAEVCGISYIGCHSSCITCKGKMTPLNDKIGVCSKCKMSQRLDKCGKQLSAKLLVSAGGKFHTLVASHHQR